MKKSTEELFNEIKEATDIDRFIDSNNGEFMSTKIAEYLNGLLMKKGLQVSEVVADSNLAKSYVYQIFNGEKSPKRNKALGICFGLHLNLDETQHLLKQFGVSELYPRNPRDSRIIFAINSGHSVFECNEDLYDHGEVIIE